MEEFKQLMQQNYLNYASYVILERAIPKLVDGLKPVQRRILFTLFNQKDEKLHKVANIVGQTMMYHPHGDAPIYEALVTLANKGYLLDRQGNFGNPFTGDPSAAARYIETRLSKLAHETMFNPDLTETIPSYDGRNQEPVSLPAKIPLLLMQGAEGIAVGMATKILPHNFVELLEAEIAVLEGEKFNLIPDFPTGGIMDASQYEAGKGKVKLRARIDIRDPKTLVIVEICYGTTTESLIRSIDEAAKKGKIKIDAINDYTAEKVEIEIKLPRGQYAKEIIDALYAYTECEVALNSQIVLIKDDLPCEMDVHEIITFYAHKLQDYLKQELELERDRLTEKIFQKTLEQIFIENRLYKKIETQKTYEAVHSTIEESLVPFHKQLPRKPNEEDREKLLSIQIRRISKFDIDKNEQEIRDIETELDSVEKDLKHVKKFTIAYLKNLIKKYGKDFKRQTEIQEIEQIDLRAIETRTVQVGFDPTTGFVGTKVVNGHILECTNFDKILLMYKDGTYQVINIPEKQYVHHEGQKVVFVGVADKKTVFNVVYRNPKTHLCFVKRFIISAFILEKVYRFMDEGMQLEMINTQTNPEVELVFIPKVKQKTGKANISVGDFLVKGVSAQGVRLSPREVKKVVVLPAKEEAAKPAESKKA